MTELHPKTLAAIAILLSILVASSFVFKGVKDGLVKRKIHYGPGSQLAEGLEARRIGFIFIVAGLALIGLGVMTAARILSLRGQ